MEFSKALHASLLDAANQARSLREIFDRFWKVEPTQRMQAHLCYFIRHVSLLNAFDNFLFLFCSRQIWTAGGTGAWAIQCDVRAPLLPVSNGDQVDKMIVLLQEHGEAVEKIFMVHKSASEKKVLEFELEHIEKVLALFSDALKEIQIQGVT